MLPLDIKLYLNASLVASREPFISKLP